MQCSVAEIVPWSRAMGEEWEVVVEAAALRYRLIRDNVWHKIRQQLKDWLRRKQWTKAKRTKMTWNVSLVAVTEKGSANTIVSKSILNLHTSLLHLNNTFFLDS